MAVKPQPKRLTEAEFWGPEPSWTGEPSRLDLIKALNWYSALKTPEDAHGWLTAHLLGVGSEDKVEDLTNYVPLMRLPVTLGWIARMMMRHLDVSQELYVYFSNRLDEIIAEGKSRRAVEDINEGVTRDSVDSKPEPPKPSRASKNEHVVRSERPPSKPPVKRKSAARRRKAA